MAPLRIHVLQRIACLVIDPFTVGYHDSLFACTMTLNAGNLLKLGKGMSLPDLKSHPFSVEL